MSNENNLILIIIVLYLWVSESFPAFFIFVRICLCILYIGGVMKRDTHHDNRIVFETQLNFLFVFVLLCICIFPLCILYIVVVDHSSPMRGAARCPPQMPTTVAPSYSESTFPFTTTTSTLNRD